MKKFPDHLIIQLEQTGILPVICPDNLAQTELLLQCVHETNLRCIEITLRSEFAVEAIATLKKLDPRLFVGAGTVMDNEKFSVAVAAGADFLVSPGLPPELLERAQRENVVFLPGCATPSEIMYAVKLGLKTVKFFPAELSGGPSALRLYESIFPELRVIPTGGITLENLASYLECPCTLACGGSFMMPKKLLKNGDKQAILQTIGAACACAKGRKIG